MNRASIFGIAGLVIVAVILVGELFYDWRTPQSDGTARYVMGVSYSVLMADFNKVEAEDKQKYGPKVETALQMHEQTISTTLDGKLVETRKPKSNFAGAYGIIMVGSKDGPSTRFPFSLAPNQDIRHRDLSLSNYFKGRFQKVPKDWVEFSDSEFTIDSCFSLPPGQGLGKIGELLQLRDGTACVVTWKTSPSSSMLLTVSRADGDPWMRPFARRLCRNITQYALARLDTKSANSPKYAACILADRPAEASTKSLSVGVYAVGSSNALDRIL